MSPYYLPHTRHSRYALCNASAEARFYLRLLYCKGLASLHQWRKRQFQNSAHENDVETRYVPLFPRRCNTAYLHPLMSVGLRLSSQCLSSFNLFQCCLLDDSRSAGFVPPHVIRSQRDLPSPRAHIISRYPGSGHEAMCRLHQVGSQVLRGLTERKKPCIRNRDAVVLVLAAIERKQIHGLEESHDKWPVVVNPRDRGFVRGALARLPFCSFLLLGSLRCFFADGWHRPRAFF